MTHVEDRLPASDLSRVAADTPLADAPRDRAKAFPWRRMFKYAVGGALLAVGAVTTYQNVLVRTSREAVLNGRTIAIRSPIDGVFTSSLPAPGSTVQLGVTLGRVDDPRPDDARVFALQQDMSAARRELGAVKQRLTYLAQARREADAQAEAYRIGRVREDQLRVEEAQANLTAAIAREADATAALQRAAALHLRGFQSDEAYEHALHAKEIAQNDKLAAQKRLDALQVDLEAARSGTYLGDNYNDVPLFVSTGARFGSSHR